MKRLLLGALFSLVSLVCITPSFADFVIMHSAATATGNGNPLPTNDKGVVGITITGTFVGTVTWEGTTNSGVTWTAASGRCHAIGTPTIVADNATAEGQFTCNVGGFTGFRAPISAYTSGSITVTGYSSSISASSTGLPALGDEGDVLQIVDGAPAFAPAVLAESDTLQSVVSRGDTVTTAVSEETAVCAGDGVNAGCIFTDPTDGVIFKAVPDANVRQRIETNKTGGVYDVEGACDIESIDPDAVTAIAGWTYTCTTIRPLKSIWFGAGALSTDGTQCAAPAEVTINSGPKIWTIICTDNDGATMGGYVKMPNNWDGGTVTFIHTYIQTAADTGVLNGDVMAQCRGNGEVPSSTWGTEVAIDDAAVVGSNANDFTASAAVTPAGTCGAGDMLYWRYQLDAGGTTTAVATLHHVGFLMKYTETSRSH